MDNIRIPMPKIDPSEYAEAKEFVLYALASRRQLVMRGDLNRRYVASSGHEGRHAVAVGLHAFEALKTAAGMEAIAKPGNKEWKQDAKAAEAVEYLLSIGFNYEDFLRADMETIEDGG